MDTNQSETTGIRTGARLLETLTSALYAAPIVVFREYVQNAIDGFPGVSCDRRLQVKIEIDDQQKRITISDNGTGIPSEKFDETMRTLGKSDKRRDNVGFRGIGRLAGLSFCKKLCFVNKCTDGTPQSFLLKGEEYRNIVSEDGSGRLDLETVMNRIVETDSPASESPVDEREQGFKVVLEGVSDELLDCVYKRKLTRGKALKQTVSQDSSASEDRAPSDEFINELSMLLPVPYKSNFFGAKQIKEKFQEWFTNDLSDREFTVLLNGEQLFKPFEDVEGTDFQILPIQILPMNGGNEAQPKEFKTIGLLWIRFDYVFKAMKQNWGIAVRSKNMLVRGGSVLAEEAADDRDAITSYGQYLSAIKGVTGELLLETNCLSDNSRRDWFMVDKNSLQLRNQLCQLMNRMHTYRYKISRYMHNDMRTEAEKQSVIQAYRELVSQKREDSDMTAVEQFMAERFQGEGSTKIDVRADERDILGYTMTQKRFYKTLMMEIYNYFEDKQITDYYALKSHVLHSLNRNSIDSESESTTGEV